MGENKIKRNGGNGRNMLNNSFTLLGIAVSEYREDEKSTKFPKKLIDIEVEKKGKSAGGVQQHTVVVYGTNRNVDTTRNLIGRKVIVEGFIDTYNGFVSLIAQDIIVLDDERVVDAPVIKPADDTEKKVVVKNIDVVELKDDDLPF